MSNSPIFLSKLDSLFAQLERQGVVYGFGAKAEGGSDPRNGHRWNPRSTGRLSTLPATISAIDCSGATRYLAYNASEGKLVLPDGSQAQREWCEAQAKNPTSGVHLVSPYSNVNTYMTDARLFIAFIRPGYHGCGGVGHVWFVTNYNSAAGADTLESHGGAGIHSRPWNYRTLINEVYSAYTLPCTA